MNLQIAPEVVTKLHALTADAQAVREMAALVERIEAAEGQSSLAASLGPALAALQSGLYVVRAGALRVFLSIEDECVLIVDIATMSYAATLSCGGPNDPRRNPLRDPSRNAAINPTLNAQLNPHLNAAINPVFNAQLNPEFNAAINPVFNAQLNPNYNAAINPAFNGSINPNTNGTINPRSNPTYPGPYVYDLDLRPSGFVVRASDAVDLVFDEAAQPAGVAVHTAGGGRALFDNWLKWVGYLVPDGQGGYLRFAPAGEWTGIVT